MSRKIFILFLFASSMLFVGNDAGLIKDLYQKITHSNNKTEDTVKQSAPICGNGVFSTPDESSLSPEIIFITSRKSKSEAINSNGGRDNLNDQFGEGEIARRRDVSEVAVEFKFNVENVTMQELERNGFNPDAPVSFLMHGFTSGYPLQAWISAIVEAYTIDRETSIKEKYHDQDGDYNHYETDRDNSDLRRNTQNGRQSERTSGNRKLKHNLFIINWNYAARGILYPRAVANIPIVASYATRFINDKLLGEARIDGRRIQLIGHSLGAHLAGFIGKNTRSKLGRIYGLDPAGPCFGAITGPLYPSSKRLAPGDAEEVITIHTNTALLGIDKPLGKYSVFVEGGVVQPGCKGGGVLKSLSTLTWDGGDFDTIACSHSRAPNLLTYRHDQSNSQDDCQLVAYECKDWNSFLAGQCGDCRSNSNSNSDSNFDGDESSSRSDEFSSLRSVDCLRIGLDWQYPLKQTSSSNGHGFSSSKVLPGSNNHQYDQDNNNQQYGKGTSTKRPLIFNQNNYTTRRYNNSRDEQYNKETDTNFEYYNSRRTSTRRPNYPAGYSSAVQRERRELRNSTEKEMSALRTSNDSVKTKSLFLRTGDTQPYCVYHYQVILDLNEPFIKKKTPSMSILLQDSQYSDHEDGRHSTSSPSSSSHSRRSEQNSLSNDEFGNKFNDKTYTHLLTSVKKLKKIDHATLIFREGLPDGFRILKALSINYMSHMDAAVRRKLSSRLCPVKTDTDRARESAVNNNNRFYFEPCDKHYSSKFTSGSSGNYSSAR